MFSREPGGKRGMFGSIRICCIGNKKIKGTSGEGKWRDKDGENSPPRPSGFIPGGIFCCFLLLFLLLHARMSVS